MKTSDFLNSDLNSQITTTDVSDQKQFEEEFDSEILFRLSDYLRDQLQCSHDELMDVLREMRNSYLAHRMNGVPISQWILHIKRDINEFLALHNLQVKYNELIDKKCLLLKKLNVNVENLRQQKIDNNSFIKDLIANIRSEYERIQLNIDYQDYRSKILQLNNVVLHFKKDYQKLVSQYDDSRDNIAHLQNENKQLKARVIASHEKNNLLKNKFNATLNRFIHETETTRHNSVVREKKLVRAIAVLNQQVGYWKHEYPKVLLQRFDDEFKKKIEDMNDYFRASSAKTDLVYANKILSIKEKDEELFKKFNDIIDKYETEQKSMENMFNTKLSNSEKNNRNINNKFIRLENRYNDKIFAEKQKQQRLKERYEKRIQQLNEANQKKMDAEVKKLSAQLSRSTQLIQNHLAKDANTRTDVKKNQTKATKSVVATSTKKPRHAKTTKAKVEFEDVHNDSDLFDDDYEGGGLYARTIPFDEPEESMEDITSEISDIISKHEEITVDEESVSQKKLRNDVKKTKKHQSDFLDEEDYVIVHNPQSLHNVEDSTDDQNTFDVSLSVRKRKKNSTVD